MDNSCDSLTKQSSDDAELVASGDKGNTIRYDSLRLNMLSELMAVCSVPPLIRDIEENPIHADNYQEFTNILERNISDLLDLISDRQFFEEELDKDDDSDVVQLQLRLLMLMCEHAPINGDLHPPYTTTNRICWKTLNQVCTNHFSSGRLLGQCLELYKVQLLGQKWRTQIGACHGFVHFSELLFKAQVEDLQTLLFILSIASQFIDCIHGEIKLLALRLYDLLLHRCSAKLILDSNVHKVVIKSCLDNCQKLLSEDCLVLLWTNVGQALCMDDAGILKDLNWNELDDSLNLLLQKIKLEGKREIRQKLRSVLMRIVNTCSGHGEKQCETNRDLMDLQQRVAKGKWKNVKLYRWTADLKELFIFECLSVSNSVESTKEALMFIGTAYLLTMFGLPGRIIRPTVEDLTMRITPLLLEVYNIYRENEGIKTVIITFLRILQTHLDQISPDETERSNYHLALNKLLIDGILD